MVEILEQGAVSFLAVPRVNGAPLGPADLEKFFVVLAPHGKRPLRRLAVGRRRLPDAQRRQRFFAYVDRIAAAPQRLTEDVRGPAGGVGSRVLAVGRYAIARHADHVHLAYALARACRRGPLAAALGIAPGGSFVLAVFRRSLPPLRRPAAAEPLAPATPETLDVIGAELALAAGAQPDGARLGPPRSRDRVGDALVGALLRKGPRPRVASFARVAASRPAATTARHTRRNGATRVR